MKMITQLYQTLIQALTAQLQICRGGLALLLSRAGRKRFKNQVVALRDSRARRQLGNDLQKTRAIVAIGILVAGVVLQNIITQPVFATSVGPNNPGTQADNSGTGTVTWTTPANVATQNATSAT